MEMPKNAKYNCVHCNFSCHKISNWNTHIQTIKHKTNVNGNTLEMQEITKNANANANYSCVCGKQYTTSSGLWKHNNKFKCNENNTVVDVEEMSDKQLIMMLIKDNTEFKNMMIEQQKYMMDIVKNGTHNTNNNNCGNTNKTFNLQFFLNETCKDAINMSDFINQIQISLSELEDTGRLGYAEGISKVFIKNLNNIDYTDRPIHCSDLKRETLYIKDNNQWAKDDANKTGLTKAIKLVANKNIRQISEWQKCHPHYSDPESKQNDKYMQIVLNSMSGSTKEESDKNYEKIAKNVIKEVVIEK